MAGPGATDGGPLRLDGGVATGLRESGVPIAAPWWTSGALLTRRRRRLLRRVHERHLAAGAQVVTANTFRCNLRALRAAGLGPAGQVRMVELAVDAARGARRPAGGADPLVAGSMAPVEDCYRPDLVPPDPQLRAEHRWLARQLVRCGVDVVLVETMNCAREARIALEQVLAAGGRAWVSLVCRSGGRLLSGEDLARVAVALRADGAQAVLVNCTAPVPTEAGLARLREADTGPIGAYPNLEDRSGIPLWTHVDRPLPAALAPAQFGALTARYRDEWGATILGGCCGTSPAHLAAMRDALATRTHPA